MDLRAEFEQAIEGMEWGELVSILEEAVLVLLEEMSKPPPPPPGLLFPVGPHFSTQPLTVGGHSRSYGPCVALEVAPNVQIAALEAAPSILDPGPLFSQAGAQVQVQYANIPVVRLPENIVLRPIGMINGELMYETLPAAFLNTFISEKSQNDSKYIRKPPNAFMLFLKEQRPKILAANTFKDSVTTNKVAGEMWRSLTKEQQSKYYHQAQVEKRLHKQGNPEWSCKNNYGKRRNRHTLGSLSRTEAFGSEHSKPGKRSRVTPLRTEHPPCQSDLMQPHQAETPVNVLPVLHRSNLPQVCSACPAAPSQFCTNSEVVRGQV